MNGGNNQNIDEDNCNDDNIIALPLTHMFRCRYGHGVLASADLTLSIKGCEGRAGAESVHEWAVNNKIRSVNEHVVDWWYTEVR